MKLDWGVWAYGLLNAVIGGTATTVSAWLGIAGAKAAGLDVSVMNFTALGSILVSAAITNLFFYLRQSPLPTIETSIVKTTVESQTVTESKNP